MLIENIIGFTAAFFISINLLPQIWKSIKTKEVEDLSLSMILIVLAGSILWLAYGVILLSWPIIVSDGFGTLTSFVLLVIKLVYGAN